MAPKSRKKKPPTAVEAPVVRLPREVPHDLATHVLDRIQVARVKMMLQIPFFGYLVSNLVDSVSRSISTAGTDGRRILWNPEWVGSLSESDLKFVMAHEAMHCALNHLWRRQGRHALRWNIATDAVINDLLVEGGMVMPVGADGKPKGITGGKGRSSEQVYQDNDIKMPPPPPPPPGGGCGDGDPGEDDGDGDGGGGDECDYPENPRDRVGPGGTMDDHTVWDKAKEGAKEDWKETLNNAKNIGKMPASLRRMIDELIHPKADWRWLLQQGLVFPDDYRYVPYDRRSTNVFLPTLVGLKHRVAVAIDTSGSMGGPKLSEFWAEIVGIARNSDIELRVMTCDADIQNEWLEDEFDVSLARMVKGGGGTAFEPVFQRLEDYARDGWIPDAMVYLTDLQGSFPDWMPAYRVYWAINKEDEAGAPLPPFGDVIVVND